MSPLWQRGARGDFLKINIFHGLLIITTILFATAACFAFTNEEILTLQSKMKGLPVGERIAAVAGEFVGVPYDPDPLGEYVTKSAVAADERVDCMYLVFRSVEIALTSSPEEAEAMALDKRFHTRGILGNGKVMNYEERFRYGEHMIDSGKWGEEITAAVGAATRVEDETPPILPSSELLKQIGKLRSGDIIFFIKAPAKRVEGELVGHMGIVKTEKVPRRAVYLIHASGKKGKGGIVKKILLKDYIRKMPFIGSRITRIS